MTKTKTIRKKNLITEEKLNKWTDEEVLTNLSMILTRAKIATDFVAEESEEGSMITHEVLVAISGDKAVFSEPRELAWPLQYLPVPEIMKN